MTLPLDIFRQNTSFHPWHFWQLTNSTVPIHSNCNTLVYENAWIMADQMGREEVRRAITGAESRLREHMNYSVGRRFVVETVTYPRTALSDHQYRFSVGSDSRWLPVRASEGMIRNAGVEAFETLDADAAVTYSDPDGDGLDELWTVTIAGVSATLNLDQVAVYFTASDRLNGAAKSDRWLIEPVQKSLSGTTLTIRGNTWLMVKPLKYQGFSPVTLNPATAANLITEVEVYRRYCDPDGLTTDDAQATLIWETSPYPAFCSATGNNLTFTENEADPAALAFATARVGIRDAALGYVTVGDSVYNATSGQWESVDWGYYRQPDRVILRYEAGAKLDSVETTLNQAGNRGRWDTIVSRFAAAELAHQIAGCEVANRELYRWQYDYGIDTEGQRGRVAAEDLRNPFGTKAGQIYAWQQVKNLNTIRAYLPG